MQDTGDHTEQLCEYSEYYTTLGLIRVGDKLAFTECIQIHQSSINSMVTLKLTNRDVLISTVGDDGALAFTRIIGTNTAEYGNVEISIDPGRPTPDYPSIQQSTLLIPKAHKSAIDALAYSFAKTNDQSALMEYHFVTCGKDQRLKAWRIIADLAKPGVQGFSVTKEENVHTVVADASSLQVLGADNRDDYRVVVAGIGMECLKLQERNPS